MPTEDYTHPTSGRVYREGDPAHRFAVLAAALERQCEEFRRHYQARLSGRDYLDQHLEWPSDPDRIARAMATTITELDKAYTAVTVDRDNWQYGLGQRDDEWERKYGDPASGPEPGTGAPNAAGVDAGSGEAGSDE
jgi:hypothetical protein